MADERDILRHCGDMGEGDDWVQRLARVNMIVDTDRLRACAQAQAIVDADIPQKYREKLAEAIRRAEQKSEPAIVAMTGAAHV